VGISVAPWVFGGVAYGESIAVAGLDTQWAGGAGGFTKGSYFAELFAEWSKKIPGGYGDASLYGKYTFLHGASTVSVPFQPGMVVLGTAVGGESTYYASFTRGNYLLGAKFVLGFNSPL